MKTKTKSVLKWLGLIVVFGICFFATTFLLAFPMNGSFKAVIGYCRYEELNEIFLQLEVLLVAILILFIYALASFVSIKNYFKPYSKPSIVFLLFNAIFLSIHVFLFPIVERTFSFGLGRTVNLQATPYFITALAHHFLLIIIIWRCYKLFAKKDTLLSISFLISIGCMAIVLFTINNSTIERCFG